MTAFLRKMHKWVGLLVGIQFLLWLLSGLAISLFDHHVVSGQHHRAPAAPARPWPAGLLAPAAALATAGQPVERLETAWLGERPAYRLHSEGKAWLIDAGGGQPLAVGSADILAAAEADYLGDGKPGTPVLLQAPGLEARRHAGPLWRVDFDDALHTSLYLSAADARVLERRNDQWRLFDIAWMLHIMDYGGREDFNHPLIVIAATAGLWMALSGVWLLVVTLRLREFVPRRWLPACRIQVLDERGKPLAAVPSFAGDTVYNALARAGMQLPSNCGGGQSCGLCEVRACRDVPGPSDADREHIAPARLRQGHRLACGMEVVGDARVAVSNGRALMASTRATVERVTAITPYLREIVLLPEVAPGQQYRPGSYVQLQIPRYAFRRERLHWPQEHDAEWRALALPAILRSRQPLRRAYSLALPVEKADGRLHLLVRFSPGRGAGSDAPGKGSSFLYSVQAGEQLLLNGPFGEFALRKGHAPKVFIGGGAGMAPLRAMIHALLDGGAQEPVQFWYGARSAREVPYRQEMEALAQRHPNFSWHTVYSDGGAADSEMVHEAVQRALHKQRERAKEYDFYLCGPPAMLAATRQMLAALGARKVAFDDFKV